MNGTTNAMEFSRTDGALFRCSVPQKINGLTVLEVMGYDAGTTPGHYARAYCLCTYGDGTVFSTHKLICADDHPDGLLRWELFLGHYDIADRDRATKQLIERAYGHLFAAATDS